MVSVLNSFVITKCHLISGSGVFLPIKDAWLSKLARSTEPGLEMVARSSLGMQRVKAFPGCQTAKIPPRAATTVKSRDRVRRNVLLLESLH